MDQGVRYSHISHLYTLASIASTGRHSGVRVAGDDTSRTRRWRYAPHPHLVTAYLLTQPVAPKVEIVLHAQHRRHLRLDEIGDDSVERQHMKLRKATCDLQMS